ncbi:MAG: SIR2 family protein, partial [Psychrosphaera sp.]|nr:SIR2 family protein [Psychrosphaera sp.]
MPVDFLEHPDFKALLSAGPILPFVGAGFSKALNKDGGGCPSWGGFLDKLYEQVKDMMTDDDTAQYQSLQGDGSAADYEAILDLLFTCAGKGKRERLIKSLFDIELPPAFKTKFDLFHQAFPGPWITTNVDRFIEKSYPSAHTPINGNDPTGLKEHLNQSDKRGLLLKIHGDVKSAKSWVLSKDEYKKAYGSEKGVDLAAPLPEFLKRLYTNYTLLFIGCSLQDDRPL